MHDVFISYAQIDKGIANLWCDKLEQKNIICWIAPRDVPLDQPYAESITDAILNCKSLLLIISSNFIKSTNVIREIEYASQNGKNIIPILIEDVPNSPQVELYLGKLQWIDAISKSPKVFDVVARQIKLLIGESRIETRDEDSNFAIEDNFFGKLKNKVQESTNAEKIKLNNKKSVGKIIENPQKKPLVFISHSSEDKIVVNAVLAKLEQEGIRCWISYRDILPGLGYGRSIIDAINKSSLMILIFSKNSHDSDQVLREIERAVSKGVPILPLRIEDIIPEGDMEYFLSAVHWLDAFEPPLNKHIQILTEKVKKLLEFEKNSGDLKTEASNELSLEKFIFDEKSV
ncbi:MAG: toll/interleukin-1 receptor domain-containing protein, partial [Methanobacterium sp.]